MPLERKKEVAHLLRHPRSKNDPGGERPLAPSHLHIASCAFLSAAILARCPLHVCSKLHNFEISRGSCRAVRRFGTRGVKGLEPPLELDTQLFWDEAWLQVPVLSGIRRVSPPRAHVKNFSQKQPYRGYSPPMLVA